MAKRKQADGEGLMVGEILVAERVWFRFWEATEPAEKSPLQGAAAFADFPSTLRTVSEKLIPGAGAGMASAITKMLVLCQISRGLKVPVESEPEAFAKAFVDFLAVTGRVPRADLIKDGEPLIVLDGIEELRAAMAEAGTLDQWGRKNR